MNQFLQNKWVVSLLGVLALLLVVNQFWPKSRPRGVARGTARKKAAAPATPGGKGGPSAGAPAVEQLPAEAADRQYLAEHFSEWREAPARDPFDSGVRVVTNDSRKRVPARQVLHLTAIWRQTGGSLAVVNNQVVEVRDVIQGYRVQAIRPDSIWVEGKNGREEVPFGIRRPASQPTKTNPAKRGAPRSRRR